MVRQDLVAGLKNAVERGSSMEIAKQSFISAGYPPAEVEAAAQFIGAGAIQMHSPIPETQRAKQPKTQAPQAAQTPTQQPGAQPQQPPKSSQTQAPVQSSQAQIQPLEEEKPEEKTELDKKKSKISWKIIILIATLILLLAILGITIVFREKVIGWFT